MTSISKLLIANRGEIACRIMRTTQEMGLQTVAVYSDADASALHVKMADEAVHIGASPAAKSYLDIEKIIAAAKNTGADAVHPGYGFLSENSTFARRCAEENIVFVGPPETAIVVMGDKARSKRAMIKAGVPCVPGYQGKDQKDKTLLSKAQDIGFPLMVKAANGGGGRGMRLVENSADLADAIKRARSEAENAFGSGNLIIEKAIFRARHVEIQVFADTHGHVIHLGERDCSVQRRHQKVIEEAPCPVMTPELRAAMGEAAVNAAKAVDYVGAGTVEFLLAEDNSFYFLEMNTRLQVEHAVTEDVTGLDLVALQLIVAGGAPLGLTQNDVTLTGASIEVRLYAEDPGKDFLPSAGPVYLWRPPYDVGLRVDDGVESGGTISPNYDPMVAKIIAKGANRDEARQRLIKALRAANLLGIQNNRDFLIDALTQQTFIDGQATTAFINDIYGDAGYFNPITNMDYMMVGIVLFALRRQAAAREALDIAPHLMDWSNSGGLETVAVYAIGEDSAVVSVKPLGHDRYLAQIDAQNCEFSVETLGHDSITLRYDGKKTDISFYQQTDKIIHMSGPTKQYVAHDISAGIARDDASEGRFVRAPMHGMIMDITVSVGDPIRTGDNLAILEAMKMQHEIVATMDGTVKSISAEPGKQIAADDLIMDVAPKEEKTE